VWIIERGLTFGLRPLVSYSRELGVKKKKSLPERHRSKKNTNCSWDRETSWPSTVHLMEQREKTRQFTPQATYVKLLFASSKDDWAIR